jgi:hypothetical protein
MNIIQLMDSINLVTKVYKLKVIQLSRKKRRLTYNNVIRRLVCMFKSKQHIQIPKICLLR